MSDAELAQIQRDIDDQLESYPRAVARFATADFDAVERRRSETKLRLTKPV